MSRPGDPVEDTETGGGLYGNEADERSQRVAFLRGEVPVAVHGLGNLGLPVAAVWAETTGNVVGVDVDETVAGTVDAGEVPYDHEPGLAELVSDLVDRGALRATADPSEVTAGIHVVVVPTLLSDDETPDLSALDAAAVNIGEVLRPGDTVCVESTMPPGTAADELLGTLSETSELDPWEFGLAACPERMSSGRALDDLRGEYPRVVGGVDEESARVAELVYDEVVDNEVVRVPDARTAECVKVFEGVYRDVNIALANELARMAADLGVDVDAAIDAANTQPYCDIHAPGPGVGGHCIPYYPHFLTATAGNEADLVPTARRVNEEMPVFTVRRLAERLLDHDVGVERATVAVLGLTYRPGVAETRKSPARDIAAVLSRLGTTVYGVDPLLDEAAVTGFEVTLVDADRLVDLSATLDAAVVVTPHREFDDLRWESMEPMVVLDGRDGLDIGHTHHDVFTLADGRETDV
jgi:UDP-N-acetyl-D-mannosaminuronic acid dehydrogenase